MVCLQSHMDMVPVSTEGYDFDFVNSPIDVIKDGDVLRADRTTLGADDGVGVAMSLAIAADKSFQHGPIEYVIIGVHCFMLGCCSL